MNGGKNYSLADFRPLIDRLGASDASYALIGGLAVALYGEKYLPSDRKKHYRFPIYSKDLDFQGDRELRTRIETEAASLGWKPKSGGTRRPKPELRRPISHWIMLQLKGGPTSIEVLEGLPVEEMEFADDAIGSWVTIDGVVVLDPCTLLVAKLAALHGRPQGEENNDAQHCEILVDVIPRFLAEVESLRSERRIEYDPVADTWRLLLVLERGRFPLPNAAAAAEDFAKWLGQFTISNLIKEGKLAPEGETRAVAEELLADHRVSNTTIAEIRVLYTVAGWYRTVLFACHGAPSHVALIDAAGRPLARPDAERALTYDRLSGGILHKLHYMEPVESEADPAQVASARGAYLRWLAEECGSMQLDGLPADSDLSVKRMKLEHLFVPLRLTEVVEANPQYWRKRTTSAEIATEPSSGNPPLAQTVGAMLEKHSRLAILAAPGGGKSTLLKRLASAYADPARLADVADDLPRRPWLPFFLRCRELRDDATRPIIDLLEALGRHLGDDAQAFRIHLHDALRAGKALLLVDGLDEISDDGTRRIFAEHLRSFVNLYKNVSLVVTSREAGFRAVAGTIADVCIQTRLAPFDESDVERLCVNWHLEVVGNTEKVRAEALELAGQIWANERIRSLVTNPLLLTTLLVVKRWVGQLPQRRVTLYSKAVEVLLMTWNVEGNAPISDEEALPQLSYLACWMMEQGVQRIARSQLLTLLKQAREELVSELYGTKLTPYEFVERIERRSSLVIQVGHDIVDNHLQPVYEFQHLTFQEYLTARGYVHGHRPRAQKDQKLLVDLLEPHFGDGEWREVIALAVVLAKRDASKIVAKLTDHADNAWKKLDHENPFQSDVSLVTLASCLLDEPPVSPVAAEEAFRLIVRTSLGYTHADFPTRFARGRFESILFEEAIARFMSLENPYLWSTEYVVACAAVKHGHPWSEENFPGVLERLLDEMNSDSDRDAVVATLVIYAIVRGTLNIPWKGISAKFLDFADRTCRTCFALLAKPSRPLLVAVCWCLEYTVDHRSSGNPVSIEIMGSLLSIIERYRRETPGGQACYAFLRLPLIDQDAFPATRKPIIGEVIKSLFNEKDDDESENWIFFQAAIIIAWYRRAPWSGGELATRIKKAFDGRMTDQARTMLSTLEDEGK